MPDNPYIRTQHKNTVEGNMLQSTLVLLFGAFLTFSTAKTPLEGDSWALLVAGSSGWVNYRHQADVCHSYHTMINEGIPEDRIIVMMYDDIAYNEENPDKGVIINEPSGINVYAGVKIDYKGSDVTPKNFLNILSGQKEAMKNIGTGRVIESNSKENVFVYFADHGATGLLAFPNSYLYADSLIKTLKTMHDKKQYNQMIMYVEACESGSMFNSKLNEHHGIIAMTAAARDESSYGCYCSNSLEVCLGDSYSVSWMYHMDGETKGTQETIFTQYQKVRSMVSRSHVELYGDFTVGPDQLTPNKDEPSMSNKSSHKWIARDLGKEVNSRQIPLYSLKAKIRKSKDLSERKQHKDKLETAIRARKVSEIIIKRLIRLATGHNDKLHNQVVNERHPILLNHFSCYRRLVSTFEHECFDAKNDYFLRHFYKFANLCILGVDTTPLLKSMSRICDPLKRFITVEIH